jgi:ferric enterobactin receptor
MYASSLCQYIYGTLVFLLLTVTDNAFAQTSLLQGQVTDTANRPLSFSTIRLPELELLVTSASDGSFSLKVPTRKVPFLLEISHVGKQTQLKQAYIGAYQRVQLKDKSLTLSEVQVSVTQRNGSSPSSIFFNRETIEQIQAFSLSDILNTLPGKANVPPDLQNPQSLILRSSATGNHALSNSLGAAVIVDGIRISNDANMQSRSLSIHGMSSAAIRANGGRFNATNDQTEFDVPFTGIDLRDIPADNIESIEVIQGIASAQYGELTSGAVIIKRQAGKTKLQLNTRINNGSTEFSLSKGFSLGKRWGALNGNVSYLNSNKDPRDKVKSYNRVAGGLMWSAYLAKQIKNTLSLDYNTKLDEVSQDPDDDSRRMTYAKSRNMRISNRTALNFKDAWFRQLNLSFSYSVGLQDTYNQWLLNGPPKGLANKDTTGIYEGIFIPGAYLAEERVIGKPIDISAGADSDATATTGAIAHVLKIGTDISYSDNKGRGIVVNPDRPRFIDNNNQNERPYDYEKLLPAIFNAGFYIQNSSSMPLGTSTLKTNMGFRYNVQNGFGNLQPRINISYPLNKKLELSIGYGISSKSPTMAHRYPAPAWLDIPLLNLYTGLPNQNLFLVYTHKVEVDNSSLKPSRSAQLETGIRYTGKKFQSSLFLYAKRDRDGFNSYNKLLPIELPEYIYTYIAGQPIQYAPTGIIYTYVSAGLHVITNGAESDNYGAEWMIQIPKVPVLQTSFTISHSFSYSSLKSRKDTYVLPVSQGAINAGSKALYGVYNPKESQNWSLMSKVNSDTHIPGIGFIVTLSADIFWAKEAASRNNSQLPVGYLNRSMQFVPIVKYDETNPDHANLKLADLDESLQTQAFIYSNLSLRIAKEIRHNIRISLSAYNFLNARSSYYDPVTETNRSLRAPVNITAGINFKF